ncbi:MAG: hypothetical protein U1F83_13665 [Verrucomicrobiota bacterium]
MKASSFLFLGSLLIACPQFASAAPVSSPWPVAGFDDAAAVGAARLSGIYAIGDSHENNVEIRDIHQNLLRTISASEIQALLPWMNLDGGRTDLRPLRYRIQAGRFSSWSMTIPWLATVGHPTG